MKVGDHRRGTGRQRSRRELAGEGARGRRLDARHGGRDGLTGEVVVLALPAAAVADALRQAGSLSGKVVVDATNNLSGGPGGLEIAALLADARYVKAFNTVFSTFMHDTPPASPATLVYCGDDADAKATVAALITDLGFDAVDAGGADVTPLVEAFGKLVIGIAYRQGRGPFVYRFQPS